MAFALVACGGSASPEVISTLEIHPATATAPDTEPVQVVPSPESATDPNLMRPRVRLVLSVEDRIRLRIDFHLVRSAG